MMASAVVAGA